MVPRIIRLRRPAVLTLHEGRFVPERGTATLDEIDERWEALRAANPAYHDGAVYHVIGVHRNGHGGASIHVIESSYRFQAVQTPGRDGFDIRHHGLGVRGIVRRIDDSGEKFLLGKRSQFVGRYPGMWEFVPAGSLPVGMQPTAALIEELQEETSLHADAAPIVIAVTFDETAQTWDIIYEVTVQPGMARREAREHDELEWVTADALPEPLSPVTVMMAELLRE